MDPRLREKFSILIRDAVGSIDRRRRGSTNLYLDIEPRGKGEKIGPRFQKITAVEKCYVVFVDHYPNARFGHPCHYRMYDVRTQRLIQQASARFPPYVDYVPKTYHAFQQPVWRPGDRDGH